MGIIGALFHTNEAQLRALRRIADRIEALEPRFAAMDDGELKAMTPALRQRLKDGETLDQLLPEAFAAAREAAWRVLGMKPFYVQLIGGIVLHQGRIAEMRTGEGKTLTEILPAYLNALSGRGVHIVTVNDYLAGRDCQWMGQVYEFLGLTAGLICPDMKLPERQAAYAADITYGTNSEFGFDYLRDNMAADLRATVQRGHVFAIVDEIDSILIDEARTPLIISGQGTESPETYLKANHFASYLKPVRVKELDPEDDTEPDGDYIVDEKARTAMLTAAGIRKAERYFCIDNISDPQNAQLFHHVNQALKAHGVMQRDVDYVVKDGTIFIVDEFTGRIMYGRRFNEGLHQAIEAKEGVEIKQESQTLATITYQNFFRMYEKLSGMTGTAKTEEKEFREIYHLDVVEVPTNRPVVRIDHPDAVFRTAESKTQAILRQIRACYEKGQPILIGTVSIEKSELLSERLTSLSIPHTVLNANHHEKEAAIVAQVGRPGSVTIATNMAGRGTDIILGGNPGTPEDAERVRSLGGLFILGAERHEARRIDNQLRGRAGRQGDPGESRFFVSLEDEVIRLYGGEKTAALLEGLTQDDGRPLEGKLLKSAIENAQKRIESTHFQARGQVLKYDDVVNEQRSLIYAQRRRVLSEEDMRAQIQSMIDQRIDEALAHYCPGDDPQGWLVKGLELTFTGLFLTAGELTGPAQPPARGQLREILLARAHETYAAKETEYAEVIRRLERMVLLQAVDQNWTGHIDALDRLRRGIHMRAYAQKDPAIEYRLEAYRMLDHMTAAIRRDTVDGLFRVRLVKREAKAEA